MSTRSTIPRPRGTRATPSGHPPVRKERRGVRPDRRAIVHVTAEYGTYARTGGLAEAVAGLATAQARAGERVYVFMPLYPSVREVSPELEPVGPPHLVRVGGIVEEVRFFRAAGDTGWPRLMFVDAPSYFARENLYGDAGADYPDNHRRFALFSRAVLDGVSELVPGPVLLHAHDWHAALIPVYLRACGIRADTLGPTPVVISVHNAGYQGHFPHFALADLGLPAQLWSPDLIEWYGRVNLLKGGLKMSDVVVTVSPTHADELRTPEGGFGLTDTFRQLGPRLVGICNGIDHDVWNPLADPVIPVRYGRDDLSGKAACKDAVQRSFGFARRTDAPLIAMPARLVRQKGLDIVLRSERVRSLDAQFVFLGMGDSEYRMALSALAGDRPQQVAVEFGFTDRLEHELLAGADMVLMPSQYEPCGLTQMHAQRYGAVVIGRRVGGICDTIEDGVTGFLFDQFHETALDAAIDRAIALRAKRRSWTAMMRRAMARDFSWTTALDAYGEVYATAERLAAAAVA
jgi:starch synthase